MRRELILTSVVSAVIGAGLMLLAVGGSKPSGIEGWGPITAEVTATLDERNGANRDSVTSASGGTADAGSAEANGNKEAGAGKVSDGTEAVTNKAVASDMGESAAGSGIASTGNGERSTTAAGTHAAADQPAGSGLISINQASAAELQNIPGIGEKKAQAIIDYRNDHGAFTTISDLTKVKGIGDKMLEKMKPYIGL